MQQTHAPSRAKNSSRREAMRLPENARLARRFLFIMQTAGIGALFLLLLKNPTVTASAALDGLLLAARTVLPSTFPYMVLSALLRSGGGADAIGRAARPVVKGLFFLPPVCAAVILMGLVSGFPVGASLAAALYREGRCTREEAERTLCFCNFCGPPFVVSGAAKFLGSTRAGLAIYLSQTAVMLTLGILLGAGARRRAGKGASSAGQTGSAPGTGMARPRRSETMQRESEKPACPKPKPPFSLLLYEALEGACRSMLQIVGAIVFFSIFSELLGKIAALGFPADKGAQMSPLLLFLRGFLEISGGTRAAAAVGGRAGVLLCALTVVWSGVSVHMQVASFALPAGLSMKNYYRCRLPAALCTAGLTSILLPLLGGL